MAGRSIVIIVAGIGSGHLRAWWLARMLEAPLHEVRRTDPGPLNCAAVVLAVVTLVTAWVPARGATRADPLETLRLD